MGAWTGWLRIATGNGLLCIGNEPLGVENFVTVFDRTLFLSSYCPLCLSHGMVFLVSTQSLSLYCFVCSTFTVSQFRYYVPGVKLGVMQ